VNDALIQCGFPKCPANYMASNPMWCQPLKVWKKYFSMWIYTPTPEAILNALIFFDFRPVYGDKRLSDALWDSFRSMVAKERLFLGYMANAIIKNAPPVGFFKSFIVEKGGEHKDELNLKIKGIAPLVDTVRLFSLEKGIKETSTLERITSLKGVHSIVTEYEEELEHAFEFIMLLRIQHQYEQIDSGRSLIIL
jgi:CBS domain-containing protein